MSHHTTIKKMPFQQIFVHTGAQPSSRLVNQADPGSIIIWWSVFSACTDETLTPNKFTLFKKGQISKTE